MYPGDIIELKFQKDNWLIYDTCTCYIFARDDKAFRAEPSLEQTHVNQNCDDSLPGTGLCIEYNMCRSDQTCDGYMLNSDRTYGVGENFTFHHIFVRLNRNANTLEVNVTCNSVMLSLFLLSLND